MGHKHHTYRKMDPVELFNEMFILSTQARHPYSYSQIYFILPHGHIGISNSFRPPGRKTMVGITKEKELFNFLPYWQRGMVANGFLGFFFCRVD